LGQSAHELAKVGVASSSLVSGQPSPHERARRLIRREAQADEPSIEEALFLWKDSPAQFADCLIGAHHRALGCTATASLDVDAVKLPAFIAV
jgi:hypothetical protein